MGRERDGMKTALVLVDLQRDFLAAPGLVPSAGEVVAGASHLLAHFRDASWPVLHVCMTVRPEPDRRMAHWRRRGDWRCLEGSPGHAAPPSLAPRPGEAMIPKTGYSGFHGTRLEELLRADGVTSLVLAGIHLHGCIRATALDAYQSGFEVWIAEDALGDDDPVHRDVTRRYLEERAVRFAPGHAILAALAAPGEDPPLSRASPSGPLLPAAWLGDRELPGPAAGSPHVSPRAARRVLWRMPDAGPEEVDAAVTAARVALRPWRRVAASEQAALFERLAGDLEAEAGDLARVLAEEVGKPLRSGRAEAAFAADLARAAVRWAHRGRAAARGGRARRVPIGVVALVTPWNNPVAVPLGKLAPALVLGNTVVWKPAPAGAARALELARKLAEAGLPAGALTVLCGGRATAQLLLAHPGVDMISLTGGEAAGATAGAIALGRGVPLQAELGGNNGAIVWGDADLPAAAEAIAEGAFGAAGQRCTANRRAIVDRTCLAPFLEHLVAATAALPWGDPLSEETVVGPLLSEGARLRVEGVVERARRDGFQVMTPHLSGGERPPEDGFYQPPAIVVADDPAAEVVQEETFGPVLVVQPATDWEAALELLDGVRQGLVAALFSPAPERRASFLDRARAGVLKLDAATAAVDARLPFGGWKRSGIGPPEHGSGDLLAYTRLQAIYGGEGS